MSRLTGRSLGHRDHANPDGPVAAGQSAGTCCALAQCAESINVYILVCDAHERLLVASCEPKPKSQKQ